MTISTTTSRQPYNGNGVTTIFAVPFRFFASTDLVVQLVTISTGASSTLILGTHYTVTGADDEDGGSLTMITAPAVGQRLVIRRVIAATQEVDYVVGDPFPAETHERALDRLTMLAQQGEEVNARALVFPSGDTASGELPAVAARASRLLGFDAAGNLAVSAPTSGSSAELALALAGTGGAALVGFQQSGAGAVARTAQSKMQETVSVKDFGAAGDGVANDYAAFMMAHDALPATGGTIIVPDSLGYYLGDTVTCTKPVRWVIGHCEIKTPENGRFAFDLQANGSSLEGAGRRATTFTLSSTAFNVISASATCALTSGAVTSVSLTGAGNNYYSTPIVEVSSSPTGDDAAIIAKVAGGAVTGLVIVAAGSGYVTPPTISFIGGGGGAVKSNEIQNSVLKSFNVNLNNRPNSVGVYHYGGWYANWSDIEIDYATAPASSIGMVVDSHTLGTPGPTGSFGGAYVNRYSNIYAPQLFLVGHDTSTGTTMQFDTLDAQRVRIFGCVGITMVNPVVQTTATFGPVFFDLVNVDGLTLVGGDVEGSGTMFRVRGSCNHIKAYGTLAYSLSGPVYVGRLGAGWDIRLARSLSTEEPIMTGSGGSAGQAFQNTGWNVKHHLGVHYAGDTLVMSSNVKLTSATTGNLDDTSSAGFALFMNASAQLVMKYANAGENPRTLIEIAQFDSGGLRITNLPSSNPGAGTRRFWYDPADANRVKFAV